MLQSTKSASKTTKVLYGASTSKRKRKLKKIQNAAPNTIEACQKPHISRDKRGKDTAASGFDLPRLD